MEFYDLKRKVKFKTENYKVVTRNVKGNPRKFAVAVSPSGIEAWRVLKG